MDTDHNADQRAYCIKVIVKQKAVTAAEAEKVLDSLDAEHQKNLHDWGRHGKVAKVRTLLGLDEPEAAAEEAPAEEPYRRKRGR